MSLSPKTAIGPDAKGAVAGAAHSSGAPTTPKPLSIGDHTRPAPGPIAAPPPQADNNGTGETGGNFEGQTPPGSPYTVPAGGRNPDDRDLTDLAEPGGTTKE